MEERLQKILARAGFGSRRTCEELIRQGRVAVNEKVAQLGQKANPERDRITVDGQPIRLPRAHTYLALYKPPGVLSDEGDGLDRHPTVLDLVPRQGHLFPVGRLDMRSEGLILLTDDGALAYRLTHPRFGHEKEYHILVTGEPDEAALERWRQGVFLDGRRTAPAEVTVIGREKEGAWLRVVLREGRKRQIRRVAAMLGYPVQRLIRVRIGPVRLGDLKPGKWRRLSPAEVRALKEHGGRGAGEQGSNGTRNTEHEVKPSTITIDGPAASGKSTIGELLARHLGYLYFDTGVMYRAVTWAALQRGIPARDENRISQLAQSLQIDVLPPTVEDGRQYTVLADGVDVTWAIRAPEVDANVSVVSAYVGVREALVAQQRRIAAGGRIVMVGRDIGSVVLPDADLKIYLDATVEERARRRWRELQARGEKADYGQILAMMRHRDEIDSHRAVSPLQVPDGAIVVDTTNLSIEEVLREVMLLITEES